MLQHSHSVRRHAGGLSRACRTLWTTAVGGPPWVLSTPAAVKETMSKSPMSTFILSDRGLVRGPAGHFFPKPSVKHPVALHGEPKVLPGVEAESAPLPPRIHAYAARASSLSFIPCRRGRTPCHSCPRRRGTLYILDGEDDHASRRVAHPGDGEQIGRNPLQGGWGLGLEIVGLGIGSRTHHKLPAYIGPKGPGAGGGGWEEVFCW